MANGSLAMRWPLLFSRLDPFVRNGIRPIIVLDNVPWAFAASNASRSVGYGNNMGPQNVTEYKGFVQALLQGMLSRYGMPVAQTFWFRVGTEPDTQPNHWNDTNAKFVEMYVAVASVVSAVIPGAMVGPANFAADGPSRVESWRRVVVPIVEAIVARGGRIDYLVRVGVRVRVRVRVRVIRVRVRVGVRVGVRVRVTVTVRVTTHRAVGQLRHLRLVHPAPRGRRHAPRASLVVGEEDVRCAVPGGA